MRNILLVSGLILIATIAGIDATDRYDEERAVSEYNHIETIVFEEKLSAYNIFEGSAANLSPASDFHLLELSSTLFTDYAQKQRLIKVPEGTQITRLKDNSVDFPDGTILVKTFYYDHDERDPTLGRRIIETRLLIKESATWNVATYQWNQNQTDANLILDGFDTKVNWIGASGNKLSTIYQVPNQNECYTCHQSHSKLTPLGPSLRNLNRNVQRNEEKLNQIIHLQSIGLLNDFQVSAISKMVDYKDSKASLSARARAYLAMNCSHCHNPSGWEKSNQRRFDFRYEIPLAETGILSKKDKIVRTMINGRMPYIGTSMVDEEGISLITDYLHSL